MKSKNWLSDLLEESSYKIYLEQQPKLVEVIRQGLSAGEPPKKIKQFVKQAAHPDLKGNYFLTIKIEK